MRISRLAIRICQSSEHEALGLSAELFLEPANLVVGRLVERHSVLPDWRCAASAAL
jgi:hypothetical protein